MDRPVLIVTPFFAPQNHAAVFRAYKLAKYLPDFGWRPIVLTVDTHYHFNEDPGLLTSLPDDVTVATSRYIEPTLRGLRMAMGGRDRTFRRMKPEILAKKDDTAAAVDGQSAAKRIYHHLLAHWCSTPDTYWTWARTAASVGRKLVREHNIKVVYTTSPPYSSLVVGRALQQSGVRWVADFRDPLCYTRKLTSDIPRIRNLQRRIVGDTLQRADAITMAASSFRSIYFDMFGRPAVEPVFIPTGIDEALVEPTPAAPSPATSPYLVFAGEILPDYDSTFWETFSLALRDDAVRQTGVRVLVIGDLVLNRRRLDPVLDRFDLQPHVEFRDQIPQRELYRILQHAVAGLLIPGIHAYWWTTFAKMIDCIGLRKPVIAVVPDPSEARTALTRTGLGVFLDGMPHERCETVREFILGKTTPIRPNLAECARYTVRSQVQSFAEIFESLQRSGD